MASMNILYGEEMEKYTFQYIGSQSWSSLLKYESNPISEFDQPKLPTELSLNWVSVVNWFEP